MNTSTSCPGNAPNPPSGGYCDGCEYLRLVPLKSGDTRRVCSFCGVKNPQPKMLGCVLGQQDNIEQSGGRA